MSKISDSFQERIIKVERRRVGDVLANENNPRTHPDIQNERLLAILGKFGKAGVLLTYKGADGRERLFDGHARQGMNHDEMWFIAETDLNHQEARELAILYDPLAALAGWREELVIETVQDLKISQDDDVLAEMLKEIAQEAGMETAESGGADTEPQVDKAEELQKKWQVKTGDIFQIGDHYLICGDCREPDTWQRLLKTAGIDKVNGVFTSPPYAMQRAKQYGGVPTDEYVEWWEAVQSNVKANLESDGSFFVNIKEHCENGQRVLYCKKLVIAMVEEWGWRFVDELFWKRQGIPGAYKERLKNAIEPVYHFAMSEIIKCKFDNVLTKFSDKSSVTSFDMFEAGNNRVSKTGSNIVGNNYVSKNFNGALPSNLIDAPQGATATQTGIYQAATFPVKLPTFFIKAYSDQNDYWLDPFAGSGTVAIACHNEGRKGLLIERLEKYCSVILEHMLDHTGIEGARIDGK